MYNTEGNIKKEIFNKIKFYVNSSNFYKNVYADLHLNEFSDIPLISKKDILLDQAMNPPFGSNVIVERKDIARIHRTSGTSGKPLLLSLTQNDINNVVKAGMRAFKTAGMESNDIVINCMNYCMWMGGFMDHMSIEATGATTIPYGVGRTENLIDLLLSMDKPSIHSTPSYLNIISKVLKEKYNKRPIELGISKGFFGGEAGMQDRNFREKIEEEWGMKAMNANYGMSEVMSIIGSECKNHDGLHFTADEVLYPELRFIDSKNASAENIKTGSVGELVLTNLNKEAQPLVRYCTGDVIEVISTEPCSCGEHSFRFKVIGRCDDMLVIKGINFYPESIRTIISSYEELTGNYKILVPEGAIVDQIKILIQKADKNASKSLIEEIKNEIKNRFFISPVIELVDDIEQNGNKQKIVERV